MKNQQEKKVYSGECQITEDSDGFTLKCKKSKPAVRVQTEEVEED